MPELSEKAKNIQMSPIASQMAIARQMIKDGIDIIDLTVGEPDTDVPDIVQKAGIRAIREGMGIYTSADGSLELKEALSKKYQCDINRISITNGGKTILSSILFSILNPGDEVIIPAPYWPCFLESVRMAGGVSHIVTCKKENRYLLVEKELSQAITTKTKAVILNSPNNPSGQAYTQSELDSLLSYCEKHNIFCIFDASYIDLTFDNKDVGYPDLSRFSDILIYVGSASKAYSMTGWRLGWSIGPVNLANAISKYLNSCIGSPSGISQKALLPALALPTKSNAEEFQKRCYVVSNMIRNSDVLDCLEPSGGIYVFVRLKKNSNDIQFADILLKTEHIAVTPGVAFGFPGYIRIACTKSIPVLQEAIKKLISFSKTY